MEGDNLEHDTSYRTNRSLVKVDSNTVALAYGSGQKDLAGFISTFTITDADASTSTESRNSSTCWDCTRPAITHPWSFRNTRWILN